MVKTRLTAEEFFALPLKGGACGRGGPGGEAAQSGARKDRRGGVFPHSPLAGGDEARDGRGGGGFVLRRDPDRVRSPDVWFLSHERLKEVAREGFYEGAPGLAVEVVSRGGGGGVSGPRSWTT